MILHNLCLSFWNEISIMFELETLWHLEMSFQDAITVVQAFSLICCLWTMLVLDIDSVYENIWYYFTLL